MVQKEKSGNYNHLKNEKSPYLIQHAQNPVDWYPWGEEAFQKAKKENKPIFLSIGYSTCHWCHVMARESFQDPEIGALINQVFVPIKVDREERPDIDCTYMAACQIMTSSGGWPLTLFLTPDLKPFFAGTYYPKQSSEISIGLQELIINVRDLWGKKEDEILQSADDIAGALMKLAKVESGDLLSQSILERAYNILNNSFDQKGGFGRVQKFPSTNHLLFLLHYWKRTGEENALYMVEKTLESMHMGGIWDHIGFGFHRYSVDPDWQIPHFEKMLYDQALLTLVHTEAYQATGKEQYRQTAEQTLQYVLRDMTSAEGGFYSAEDAESEGIEGKFYLWTTEELGRTLNADELIIFNQLYPVKEKGNFKSEETGLQSGRNILHLKSSLDEITKNMELKPGEFPQIMSVIREKLFKAREERVHPHKDDKILTDWNGLMIAALARASRTFNEDDFTEAAWKAIDFIKTNLFHEGKLWHRYRQGDVKVEGYLDDYAFLIWGLLELYEATLDSSLLQWASELNQYLMDNFSDKKDGGFYFTSQKGEKVLIRKKEAYDSAIPSGNAVSYLNLLHLSTLLEDTQLNKMAMELEESFASSIKQSPSAYTTFLTGLMLRLGPLYEVVIAGERENKKTQSLIDVLKTNYLPHVVFSLNSPDNQWLKDNVKSFQDKKPLNGQVTAYVCKQGACYSPTHSSRELLDLLMI